MTQLLVQDSAVFDLSDVAGDLTFNSVWNNGASTLSFSYPARGGRRFTNGSTVTFVYNKCKIFYGYLFKTKQDKKQYFCTCYGQLRYFKPSNTILRKEQPLSAWVNAVAAQVSDNDRIRLGNVSGGGANLSKKLFDGKTHLDMLYDSIKETLYLTGEWYTLFDNFGALDLTETKDLRLPLIIGDSSLATDFEYENSIDESTANFILLTKDDKEKGVRGLYEAKDSSTISKWGKLMYYEKISNNRNEAQMAQLANSLLELKNKETKKVHIEALGDGRIKGGSGLKVEIKEAGLSFWAVVESVSHHFTSSQHVMSCELLKGEN